MSPEEDQTIPPAELSPSQIRALFDILTHYETYAEISSFKSPEAITSYGFPFKKTTAVSTTPLATAPGTPRVRTPISFFSSSDSRKQSPVSSTKSLEDDSDSAQDVLSTSPILQLLLTRIILPLPGVSEFPRSFWSIRVQSIMARLGEAELSESYDKGAMGTRKTLATGTSALVEMVGRGILGGVDRESNTVKDGKYDHGSADDLERAWGDVVQALVYGDLVNELFDHFVHSDDMETISSTVEASARHNIFQFVPLISFVL